jgi:hypothetical protein
MAAFFITGGLLFVLQWWRQDTVIPMVELSFEQINSLRAANPTVSKVAADAG